MSRFKIFGFCFVALMIVKNELTPPSTIGVATQKLSVREEAGRVVLAWSGPIVKPMRDDLAAAIEKFKTDPRRLVLTLNSPGGSVQEGHKVMTAIREAARLRRIDMRIENGAACASMCVPIYLLGTERTADPSGHFMFHEVNLNLSAAQEGGEKTPIVNAGSRKIIETLATDVLYVKDLGGERVNAHWLKEMRTKIIGREIWVSAQQLVDESSGIVDALVPTAVN